MWRQRITRTVAKYHGTSTDYVWKLVDPNPLWFETPLQDLSHLPKSSVKLSSEATTKLQERGLRLLTELGETFSGSLKSNDKHDSLAASSTLSASDRTFIATILSSGTSSDKLSALVLLTSSSPLHTTTYLKRSDRLSRR